MRLMSLKSTFSLLCIILLSMFATAGPVYPQTPSGPRMSGTVKGLTSDFVGALVPKEVSFL